MPSNSRSPGMITLSHSSRNACAAWDSRPSDRRVRSRFRPAACRLPPEGAHRRRHLPRRGINLNSGVFNPELLVPHPSPTVSSIWGKARLRDRCDAVIAHEYHEGQGVSHSEAERRAADTELRITDGPGASCVRWRKGNDDAAQSHNRSSRSRRHRQRAPHRRPAPLEIDVVDRLLKELGGIDKDGTPTLERGKVEFRDGYLVCPWASGAGTTEGPRNSRSASSRRRDASWPTASIRGSSSRSSYRG